MDELTVVLSGPSQFAPALRNALGHQGWTVEPGHHHGMPAIPATEQHPDGQHDTNTTWLHVHAPDNALDDVVATARQHTYTLRAHHTKAQPPPEDPLSQRLAAIEQRLGIVTQ